MNGVHARNNRYKNGEYDPHYSTAIARGKAKNIEPSISQLQYRDDLYKFCVEKGIRMDRFHLGRTKKEIRANIYALISILKKNSLDEEFFGKAKQPAKGDGNNG